MAKLENKSNVLVGRCIFYAIECPWYHTRSIATDDNVVVHCGIMYAQREARSKEAKRSERQRSKELERGERRLRDGLVGGSLVVWSIRSGWVLLMPIR